MNQDTRKDPRAKVLTMTVRYKSATLDEFIEHHSYDVSRGGMFIKTPSPFPPGTLLKFEVKIADEQRLMQGVGRVVWKREANDSNDARPAGMGVKFIKIDDESRRTIERLVDARGGDGDNAFDQGNAPRVPVAPTPTGAVPSAIPSSTAPTKPLEQPAAAAGRSRKSTVIGLGAMKPSGISGSSQRAVTISSGPPRTVTPSPPQTQEKPAEAFFPKTDSRADMPPVEDQTMMKQAKELLADAMRYAGGTAEDVKAAAKVSSIPPHVPRPEPHKSVPPRPTAKVDVPKTRAPFPEQGEEGEAATTIWRANEAAALLAESMKDSEPPQGEEIHGRITARPPAEGAEPEAPRFRDSEPATTPGNTSEEERSSAGKLAAAAKLKPEHVETETPASEPPKPSAKTAATAPVSVSERPSSRTRASQAMMEAANEAASEGGGGKGVFALLALAAAAGIGFYVTRPPAAAPEPPPPPAAVEAAKPAPTPEPTPIATAPEPPPSAAASAAPVESASAAPPASASAAPEPPASAAPEPEVAEKPPAKPAPRRVVVPRRAPAKKKPELSGEESEAPPAEAAPKPPADAAPEAPPPAPPPPTPPSPTPPSPAAPPLGDNPY